jgi:1-deoxy-D-xylulose-5-phosphate reductoisomerase
MAHHEVMQDLLTPREMWELDTAQPLRLAVLGSTGSIGRQALDVVRAHPDRFQVVALAAASDAGTLLAQAQEFDVRLVGLASGLPDAPAGLEILDGEDAAARAAEAAPCDLVLNAVVGSAGLQATMATLQAGKVLALANKESLVAAGEAVMAKAAPGQIRPVDSEHSALWQLLEGLPAHAVAKVMLTGSGGPFRGRKLLDLQDVTVEEALAHPIWDMGPKITVDSATLMNKGLEVIEAHFLFGFTYDEIDVLIHPQGLLHALVETVDGAVFAHAAQPDMRLPIQVALLWPDRVGAPDGKRIDWEAVGEITFEPPDTETFRCLTLAYEAGRRGDTYPAALNAANEVAVAAFIDRRLGFPKIPTVIEQVLEGHEALPATLDAVYATDTWARRRAEAIVASLGGES